MLQLLGVLILIVIVVVVAIVLRSRSEDETVNTNTTQAINQSTNAAVLLNSSVKRVNDDDNDGLSNDEETALGTRTTSADTDSDGLTDYDEVKVYKSDPKKADTDSDGNDDGVEVQNGYSPVDGTKLLDLDREKKQFTQ